MRIVWSKVDDDLHYTSGGAIVRIICSSFSLSTLMVPPREDGGSALSQDVFPMLS
jgi:hypothetical protein